VLLLKDNSKLKNAKIQISLEDKSIVALEATTNSNGYFE